MSALDLADAKTHLNITGNEHDAELQSVIDAAEATIARHVGPLEPEVVTHRVSGCVDTLVLPVAPAVSLTTVSPRNSTDLVVDDLALDEEAGLVTCTDGSRFPGSSYLVTYVAGRTELPDDLLMAVKEMTRHLWLSQRGPQKRPGQGSTSDQRQVPGYLMPYAVAELLAPHEQIALA